VKLLLDAEMAHAIPAPFLALVDAQIDGALHAERTDAEASAPPAVVLVQELVRTIASGGKRIRPVFCHWGHRAAGGEGTDALAAVGAAIEILHTAALIHDDVVDGSKLRRGEPSAFRRLAEAMPLGDERSGRSAAILAGDLAQAVADRLLAGSAFEAERVVQAFAIFNRMRIDAIRGEYLDLLAASAGAASEEEARHVGALKSGSYTVVGPLLIGAALAAPGGAAGAVGEALRAYGEPLGVAFQLRDDVLGTFGDPDVTGKDPDDDLREGKQTLLVAAARRLAAPGERRALEDALGRPDLSTESAQRARAALRTSGALDETLDAIDALADRARDAIAPVEAIAPAVRDALLSLAGLVAVREG
jgi:geranylgeranyl diphosphate synthase type I